MRRKLARCKQTADGETEHGECKETESFVWTRHEAELLLRLTLNYKTSKFRKAQYLLQHEHVGRHCCCYETSRVQRSSGGKMASV